MSSGFLLFIACGLIFSGVFGIAIADIGHKTQFDPNRVPVKFRFRSNYDAGHGGSSREFILERKKEKYLIKSLESRRFPQPGEKDFKPVTVERKQERPPEAAERFLNILVNDLKIEEMGNLKARVLLHPTYYDFEMRYADGRVHQLGYVVEAGHHVDERYGRLVDECQEFFEIK